MPEFILETAGRVPIAGADHIQGATLAFDNLDEFTRGYIEALFFTSECPGVDTEEFLTAEHQEAMREGQADGVLPGDVGFADLHPEALKEIIEDCQAFQRDAAELLAAAYARTNSAWQAGDGSLGIGGPAEPYSAASAGRDFWFTRNGHGVGFWDRDALKADDLGEQLSTRARTYGETDAFFGNDHIRPDGCVHLS